MAKTPATKTVSELQAELAGAHAQIESLQAALEAKGDGEVEEGEADPLAKDKRLLELEMELAVEKDRSELFKKRADAIAAGNGHAKLPTEGEPRKMHGAFAGFHPANIEDMPTLDELNANTKG